MCVCVADQKQEPCTILYVCLPSRMQIKIASTECIYSFEVTGIELYLDSIGYIPARRYSASVGA